MTRALLVLLLVAGLFVGLVAGLVALAGRFASDVAVPWRSVCTARVAAPEAEGEALEAELAPDQTANAALVVGLANQRGLPARAATIGVATAIQESGLRNVDYGDRDSLGLFQQRPSQGWGTEEQVQDPVYATGAFYDALVRVDGYTGLEVTVAAQRVQRSGFPDAYADHEDEGRALASSLYGLSEAALWCELDAVAPADRATTAAARDALVAGLETAGPPGWTVEDAGGTEAGGTTGTAAAAVTLSLSTAGATDPGRTAWALAHTAVALADEHDVVRVEVDGRVWDREADEPGWQDGGATTDGVLVSWAAPED